MVPRCEARHVDGEVGHEALYGLLELVDERRALSFCILKSVGVLSKEACVLLPLAPPVSWNTTRSQSQVERAGTQNRISSHRCRSLSIRSKDAYDRAAGHASSLTIRCGRSHSRKGARRRTDSADE